MRFFVVETPVGALCPYCDDAIKADDEGVVFPHIGDAFQPKTLAWHRGCFLQSLGLADRCI